MQGLIDLLGLIGGGDVGADVAAHGQAIKAQQIADAQMARQLAAQKQLDTARAEAIANPSAANFGKLFLLAPQEHEAIKSAWQTKDADSQKTDLADLSSVRGYLRAGKPDLARNVIQRRIDADKKVGQDTTDDEEFLGLIDEDPEGAAGHTDYMIAASIGPEKWDAAFGKIDDGRRADTKLPGEVTKTVSEATLNQANAAKTLTETGEIAPNAQAERELKSAQVANYQSAIDERAARLALDRDTLETNTGLKLEEMAQARDNRPLSGVAEQTLTTSVVAAESSRQLASRMTDLAEKVEGANLSGGWVSWLAQNGGNAYGKPNLLRKEYTTLINAQAVKNLPPGPASDKDIKLALSGYPPATADAPTMSSWLRGVAKLQNIAANREQARADWISDNGTLGRAKRDLTVNGVKVPAGSTFADFSASAAAVERREAVTDRGYMRFGK